MLGLVRRERGRGRRRARAPGGDAGRGRGDPVHRDHARHRRPGPVRAVLVGAGRRDRDGVARGLRPAPGPRRPRRHALRRSHGDRSDRLPAGRDPRDRLRRRVLAAHAGLHPRPGPPPPGGVVRAGRPRRAGPGVRPGGRRAAGRHRPMGPGRRPARPRESRRGLPVRGRGLHRLRPHEPLVRGAVAPGRRPPGVPPRRAARGGGGRRGARGGRLRRPDAPLAHGDRPRRAGPGGRLRDPRLLRRPRSRTAGTPRDSPRGGAGSRAESASTWQALPLRSRPRPWSRRSSTG